jgi:PPE-repeat protein
MYGYAGASATAVKVTPFTAPPQTTNPVELAGQAAAVAKASGTSAGTSSQTTASTIPQLISASTVPQVLQQLSSSASSSTSTSWLQQILNALGSTVGVSYYGLGTAQYSASIGNQLMPDTPGGAGAIGSAPVVPGGWALPGLGGLAGVCGGGPVSAGLGQAGTIGRLSVPPSWAAAPSAINSAAPRLFGTHAHAVSATPGGLLHGVPLTGAGRRSGGFIHRYGFRHSVMPRPPSGG